MNARKCLSCKGNWACRRSRITEQEGTPQVKRTARRRVRPRRHRMTVTADADGLVGLSGAALLTETAAVVGSGTVGGVGAVA